MRCCPKNISPSKEIIFVPSGGVKGISGIVSILGGKNNDLPYVIVDSDKSGKDYVNKLYSDLYKDEREKVIEIQTITEMENSEIEDIIPYSVLEKGINHFFLCLSSRKCIKGARKSA